MSEENEFNEHTGEQMQKISDDLMSLQLQYDTRLLAASMAARAASLYAMLVNADIMTNEEAHEVWLQAGESIDEERNVKVMNMVDNQIMDPDTFN